MPCPECKSPTRHKATCSKSTEKPAASAKAKATAKTRVVHNPAAKPDDCEPCSSVVTKRRAKPKLVETERAAEQTELAIVRAELAAMTVEAVIKQRDDALALSRACDEELRRRRRQIEEALNELPDPPDVRVAL